MNSEKLAVVLTDAEMKIVAEELGAMESEMAAIRESKRASAKHYAALIENLLEKIAYKAKVAIDGQEIRNVEVEWVQDSLAGVKRLIRLDNGNEVRNVLLSESERQHGLFDAVVEAAPEPSEELLADPETAVADAAAGDPDSPAKHVGSVMASSDDEWIADCRCGWVGEMRSTEDAAIQDLDNHYAGDAYKEQPVETDPEAEAQKQEDARDEQYDASHANASGRGRKKKKEVPEAVGTAAE